MAGPTQVSKRFLKPSIQASLSLADTSLQLADKQALQGLITSEQTRAMGIEGPLRTDINNEISRATAEENKMLKLDGTRAMTASLNAGTFKVSNMADGAAASDASSFGQLSAEITRAQGIESGLRSDVNATVIVANAAIPSVQKAAANGVATLGSDGKVPTSQLPTSVTAPGSLSYKGTLDASASSVYPAASKGDYYVISVAGTIAGHAYSVGDWATYDGTTWDYIDNSIKVSSVAGRQGAVVLSTIDVSENAANLYYTAARAKADVQPNIDSAVLAEKNRALGIEGPLRTDLTNEISRAQAAEVSAQNTANAALPKAGGTMSGVINMGAQLISNLADPVSAQDAATKGFVLSNGAISKKELFTLAGTAGSAPTNTYIDLMFIAKTDSVQFISDGLLLSEGAGYDYTVMPTGGFGGMTRINFEANLKAGGATPLLAGDVVVIQYGHN